MNIQEVLPALLKGDLARRNIPGDKQWDDCYIGYDGRGFYYSAGMPGHGSVIIQTSFTPADLMAIDWVSVPYVLPGQCNHPRCQGLTPRDRRNG